MGAVTTILPRLSLAAVSAALCTLAFAMPAHAARNMEVSLQDDAVFVHQFHMSRAAALAQARALGVNSLRVNLPWAGVLGKQAKAARKPKRLRYNFKKYDALVNQARPYGIRVQFTLWGPAPRWATGNHKVGLYAPKVGEFARFAQTAARHFRGRVHRYSIWNEPNWHSFFPPLRTAISRYRTLYRAGYKAVKRGDRRAQVLFGELAPVGTRGKAIAPLRFLRSVAYRGARLKANGLAQHVYDFRHSPSFRRTPKDTVTVGTIGRLVTTLNRLKAARALSTPGGRPLDIYGTEFGYFATGRRALPAATRAAWTTQGFAIMRASPRVRQMTYYMLVEQYGVGWNTGLMPRTGPGLAFNALAQWTAAQRAAGLLR
jgi:hypothetical protein